MTNPAVDPTSRRTLLFVGVAAVAVVLIGLAIALTGSSDSPSSTDADPAGATEPAFGPVTIQGDDLAAFSSTADDPADGAAAPLVQGKTASGDAVSIGGPGQPTVVAFLAHWCPHCQRELPILVELMADGELEGMRVVAVLTGSNKKAPNYPPMAWLRREGWTGEVLLDDETSATAQSYGLSSYPFLVFLDADGNVVARASGELPASDVAALARSAR